MAAGFEFVDPGVAAALSRNQEQLSLKEFIWRFILVIVSVTLLLSCVCCRWLSALCRDRRRKLKIHLIAIGFAHEDEEKPEKGKERNLSPPTGSDDQNRLVKLDKKYSALEEQLDLELTRSSSNLMVSSLAGKLAKLERIQDDLSRSKFEESLSRSNSIRPGIEKSGSTSSRPGFDWLERMVNEKMDLDYPPSEELQATPWLLSSVLVNGHDQDPPVCANESPGGRRTTSHAAGRRTTPHTGSTSFSSPSEHSRVVPVEGTRRYDSVDPSEATRTPYSEYDLVCSSEAPRGRRTTSRSGDNGGCDSVDPSEATRTPYSEYDLVCSSEAPRGRRTTSRSGGRRTTPRTGSTSSSNHSQHSSVVTVDGLGAGGYYVNSQRSYGGYDSVNPIGATGIPHMQYDPYPAGDEYSSRTLPGSVIVDSDKQPYAERSSSKAPSASSCLIVEVGPARADLDELDRDLLASLGWA